MSIKKPAFNADAAEEYFSDLMTFYRNTANDIFSRDNDGRSASNQIYSAEYQKWLGMQAAMREVLEYFSKYDLCEWIAEIPDNRLRELVEADRDGRCVVLPKPIGSSVYRIEYVESSNGWFEIGIKEHRFDFLFFAFERKNIGKTVFFDRESAEAALKGEQDG